MGPFTTWKDGRGTERDGKTGEGERIAGEGLAPIQNNEKSAPMTTNHFGAFCSVIFQLRMQSDLKDIAAAFFRNYKKLLREFVADDCSGDYRKLLLLILGSL